MNFNRGFHWGAVCSGLLLLVSCGSGGGDGGGSSDPVPDNVSATALRIETLEPRIAYPLQVSMDITADGEGKNITVSLIAFDKTEDPEAEVRQMPLGTVTIEQLNDGLDTYLLEVNIPSSVELPGEYFLAAIIDPVDEVDETNEDDNTASVEMTIASQGSPNVLITELNLDRLALLLNTDNYFDQVTGEIGNVYNADAGATITVGAEGLEVGETIDIEAFARLRLKRTDNGTSHDVPLYLWNSDQERYMNAYGVDPSGTTSNALVEWLPLGTFEPQLLQTVNEEVTLDDIKHNSTQLNFYSPGGFGEAVEYAMRYAIDCTVNCPLSVPTFPTDPPPDLTAEAINQLAGFLDGLPITSYGDASAALAVMEFEICVEVRPSNLAISDRIAEDNELCEPISITLPSLDPPPPPTPDTGGYVPEYSTPAGPLSSGDGYESKGGGSSFSFGPIDFGASSSADHRGYIEEIHGGIPVIVFGGLFNFVDASVRAQLVPDYDGLPAGNETGLTIELRFLNLMIDSLDTGPLTVSTTVPLSYQATMSHSVEAPNPPKEKQFFVGPVPMIASASVAGNIGIQYEFVFEDGKIFDNREHLALGNSVSPFANVEVTLSAGVGTALFSVGVEGVLTLLDERLEFFVGTRIYEIPDAAERGAVTEFLIIQGETLSNIFTGPQGAINLFAKYTVPKLVTCSWGFIKGKCIRTKSVKATKNIWRSPALFRFDDILYDSRDVVLDVVILPGEDPMYFVPP